ncbi:MAG TPA: hypothetical protein VGX23_05480 [Actinocrinis sp.]|nr:hypothetical protein [Actinocrinis sp.]
MAVKSREHGGARALWYPLLLVLAAAGWVAADLLKASMSVQLATALAAAVVPIVISSLRDQTEQEDELTRVLRTHLRIYGSAQGIPLVCSITDLTVLAVTSVREPLDGAARTTQYVLRDQDALLDRLLGTATFVLIIGDSKAGKSRMAAEAARRCFPDRRLVYPYTAESVLALLDAGLDLAESVIWLDELDVYLEANALSRLLDQLAGPDAPAGVTVLATMTERAFGANLPHDGHQPPHWPVLRRAARLRLDRLFSAAERARAAEAYDDPHLLSALDHYGLAEYLAAGPDLLERLDHGLAEVGASGALAFGAPPVSCAPGDLGADSAAIAAAADTAEIADPARATEPGQLIGAVVVLAVVHWSRAGLARPVPAQILILLTGGYAAARGLPAPDQAQIDQGLAWARKPVYGVSSLLFEAADGYVAFDYVVDHADERLTAAIPDETWNAALAAARGWEEALRIGFAAHRRDRADVAVRAFDLAARSSTQAGRSLACFNLALALERTNRLQEAQEQYLRAAADGHTEAALAAGRLLQAQGETAEAERHYRIAADAGHIDGSYALGMLLRADNPDQALHHLATAADHGHTDAAFAAGTLLRSQGAADEARRHYRMAADAGHVDSSYALGMLLRALDPDESLRRLTTAADHGHADAAYTAALQLREQGNTTAAGRFFRIAAENRESGGIQRFTPAAEVLHVAPPRLRLRGGAEKLRRCESLLARTADLEQTMADRPDGRLRGHTGMFRRRLAAGEDLDALAPEAFATLREAARRIAGLDGGDEEILAGAAMHHGLVAQVRARRGRLLALALPAYLNALAGRPVHVLSVDEPAARRDAERLGPVLRFLGLDTGTLAADMLQEPRRLVYDNEVVFGTLAEFAFDYLRDRRVLEAGQRIQGELGLALVPHADLQLLDRLDESFRLPGPAQAASPWFGPFAALAKRMQPGRHYEIDRPARRVVATDAGIALVQDTLGIDSLYTEDDIPLADHLNLALQAKEFHQRGVDYDLRGGAIVVLDESTGRARVNSTFDDGMHQAIEAKEGLAPSPRAVTRLRIGTRGYLGEYAAIGGLATAVGFSDEVFHLCYGVNAVRIPPDAPVSRTDGDDWVFLTDDARLTALADLVRGRHATGQPVLVDVGSTPLAEQLGAALDRLDVPHTTLTTRNREHESRILGAAGRAGRVTVAVNAHLSLVHIPLGGPDPSPADQDAVAAVGGLLVVGAQRHVERWRDDRLREAAGRDGRRGESRFLLAMTDPVTQGTWTPGFVGDQQLSSMMLTWGIESRQRQLAALHLEQLKQQLAFDAVEERHRRAFCALRERALTGRDISTLTYGYLLDTLERMVREHSDWTTLDAALSRLCGPRVDQFALPAGEFALPADESQPPLAGTEQSSAQDWDPDAVLTMVTAIGDRAWSAREQHLGTGTWTELQRRVLLSLLDQSWPEHLAALADLRRSAPLAALRNADPLTEYERAAEAHVAEMHAALQEQTVGYLMNLQVRIEPA